MYHQMEETMISTPGITYHVFCVYSISLSQQCKSISISVVSWYYLLGTVLRTFDLLIWPS